MKVLIFDTETSGLEPWLHEMLQLAWQVVDTGDWSVLAQHNCYFPLPKDKRKVSPQAIRVNGLTASVLESKGTMQRSKAIRMFAADMATVDACAAHNLYFDKDFVRVKDTKKLVSWPEECICTMLRTTELCAIPGYRDGDYKWPRLSELADFLGVDTSGIQYHDAMADVEVTKRCLKVLFEEYWK